MLTANGEGVANPTNERTASNEPAADRCDNRDETGSSLRQGRLAQALRLEWLGQTVASLCWITSVFMYGISSAGDWLQLFAASSWLLANIAAVMTVRAD